MRRALMLGLMATLVATTVIGVAGPAVAGQQATYYVSVGDSAAAGFQPNGRFDRGYADQLHYRYQAHDPRLQLVKLGCPGETTESMISGVNSPCSFPAGSQLDQATS